MSFPSDLEIARAGKPLPLKDIAQQMGIGEHLLEPYGTSLAKISLDAIEELKSRPKAKYVVVTAITPTPLGEGKTTTTVGLGMAMKHIGKKAVISLRQPSMGPTFGIKGGAAGGGYSQVIPMELLNQISGLINTSIGTTFYRNSPHERRFSSRRHDMRWLRRQR